jgi:hypothetical protein
MAAMSNHRRAHHSLTDDEIAAILFNETRSLSGDSIAQARANAAHAIINAQASSHRMPPMAPRVAHIPPAEQDAYTACREAVRTARSDITSGQDPTNGATHFNFRKNNSTADFQGHQIRTNVGPLNNSYPTSDLPASGVYANTYL